MALDVRPRPSPPPACYAPLTRARLKHTEVTKSSRHFPQETVLLLSGKKATYES